MEFHQPVLLAESVQQLITNPDGIYVDVTFGGGGHSKKILENLGREGRIFSFDKDADAAANEREIEDERFVLIRSDFRFLKEYMDYYRIDKIDGLLADLGVSSHQLNVGQRGFAYRLSGDLDMRMDQRARKTAADILNTYSKEELIQVFSRYGEVRNAIQLATLILRERQRITFRDIEHFVRQIRPVIRGKEAKYLAQVFQALRIEVNGEMESLKIMLESARDLLIPNGRLVAISYHSLEDRMVKNLVKTGNVEGKVLRDDFGKIKRFFRPLYKGIYKASPEELKENSRARSAKMRTGIRTEEI